LLRDGTPPSFQWGIGMESGCASPWKMFALIFPGAFRTIIGIRVEGVNTEMGSDLKTETGVGPSPRPPFLTLTH